MPDEPINVNEFQEAIDLFNEYRDAYSQPEMRSWKRMSSSRAALSLPGSSNTSAKDEDINSLIIAMASYFDIYDTSGNYNGDDSRVIDPKIGDVGPSGGIIFYDKGSWQYGWRYLELAPDDEETTGTWGLPGTDSNLPLIEVNNSILAEGLTELVYKSQPYTLNAKDGQANHYAVIRDYMFNIHGIENGYASKIAIDLPIDGYVGTYFYYHGIYNPTYGWYLPSIWELYAIERSGILASGKAYMDGEYWSSNTATNFTSEAVTVRFRGYNGTIGGRTVRSRTSTQKIRAIKKVPYQTNGDPVPANPTLSSIGSGPITNDKVEELKNAGLTLTTEPYCWACYGGDVGIGCSQCYTSDYTTCSCHNANHVFECILYGGTIHYELSCGAVWNTTYGGLPLGAIGCSAEAKYCGCNGFHLTYCRCNGSCYDNKAYGTKCSHQHSVAYCQKHGVKLCTDHGIHFCDEYYDAQRCTAPYNWANGCTACYGANYTFDDYKLGVGVHDIDVTMQNTTLDDVTHTSTRYDWNSGNHCSASQYATCVCDVGTDK